MNTLHEVAILRYHPLILFFRLFVAIRHPRDGAPEQRNEDENHPRPLIISFIFRIPLSFHFF
jgi:hypothetical protein